MTQPARPEWLARYQSMVISMCAEVQPQMLDGMRQAAAVHAVARRMPADGGEAPRVHASEQGFGVGRKLTKRGRISAQTCARGELGVAVALERRVADAAQHPPLGGRDGVRADRRERVRLGAGGCQVNASAGSGSSASRYH